MWGQIQERQTAVEKQLDNIAVPDTAELRERLAAVEEKAFNIGASSNQAEELVDWFLETLANDITETKNDDVNYKSTNLFNSVKDEFEAIAGIVALTDEWKEV